MRATLRHVDRALDETLRLLGTGRSPPAFAREVADATPVQRKLAVDYANRIRDALSHALSRLGVEVPEPDVSAVRAARVALRLVAIAASELAPRELRGYGPLGDEAAREINTVVRTIVDLLQQMEGFLARGTDLDARPRSLAEPSDDARAG